MRGSRRPGSRAVLALCACFALSGCPAQWKFVFINDDAEPLLVRVESTEAWIDPGERWRTLVRLHASESEAVATVTVKDANDELLHSISVVELFKSPPRSEYPNQYIRVTRKLLFKISEATAKRLPEK